MHSPISVPNNNVFVSLLASDNYLEGVLTLAYSLKRVQSQYKLVIAITDDVSEEARAALAESEIATRLIRNYKPSYFQNVANIWTNERFSRALTKLCIFSWTEFEKIVFLDADILILKNIDELFNIELEYHGINTLVAVPACICFDPEVAKQRPTYWKTENCTFTKIEDLIKEDDNRKAGYQRVVAKEATKDIGGFNSGVMIFSPGSHWARKMIDNEAKLLQCKYLYDQEFLHYCVGENWISLPYIYNTTPKILRKHPKLADFRSVKILHFIKRKPWESESLCSVDEFYKLWSDFNTERRNQKFVSEDR